MNFTLGKLWLSKAGQSRELWVNKIKCCWETKCDWNWKVFIKLNTMDIAFIRMAVLEVKSEWLCVMTEVIWGWLKKQNQELFENLKQLFTSVPINYLILHP